MGKSSKTFYCHNTKLTETEGWPTNDKKGVVVINDWKNNVMFHIAFGKNPKVFIFNTDSEGNIISECRLEGTLREMVNKKVDIAIKEFVNGFNNTLKEEPKTKKVKVKKGYESIYNDIDDLFLKM